MSKIENVIYKISITDSDKIYIGSAVDFKRRKSRHICLLESHIHPNKHLQNSYIKHGGISSFSMEILERVSRENLLEKEQFYINQYLFKDLFNLCPLAKSNLGRKCSEETIEKIKENSKNNYYSENLANFRGWWKGKKRSEENKLKISENNKKRVWTEESRKKLSETQKSKNRKMSAAQKDILYCVNKGSKRTEETKQKMSQALKDKPKSDTHKENMSKSHSRKRAVKQINLETLEVIKIFESITEASKEVKCADSSINACLSKKSKSCKGYLWEYI